MTREENNAVVIDKAVQKDRVFLAGVKMNKEQLEKYYKMDNDLGEWNGKSAIPAGYKKCGKCQHILKFCMFNKNKDAKTYTTGNCKACQKATAKKSYKKMKGKRDHKKYYANHKEEKQASARKYYLEHRAEVTQKHKEYLNTPKGKKVMQRAHAKRLKAMELHKGIPWKREWVIDKDKRGGDKPICYLCGKPIEDTSGKGCHIDHIVSVGNGGMDCFTNVAAVHQKCNLVKEKDDRNLEVETVEFMTKLAEDYIDAHPELFDDAESEDKND